MERNFKIAIPEPCHENWDTMTPNENGRFCMSCSKTVVDFTTMLPDEVQHFFIQNENNSICGRFENEQLSNLIIPNRILYTQTSYHKMFLLALFVIMGTTLFSCSDKNGNKQKIDKVEIVEDSSIGKNIQVGDIKINKNDSACNFLPPPPPPPPPRTVEHMQFVKGKMRTEKLISRTSGEVILIPQSDKIRSKNIDSSKIETKRN